jgi:hypothetical protein
MSKHKIPRLIRRVCFLTVQASLIALSTTKEFRDLGANAHLCDKETFSGLPPISLQGEAAQSHGGRGKDLTDGSPQPWKSFDTQTVLLERRREVYLQEAGHFVSFADRESHPVAVAATESSRCVRCYSFRAAVVSYLKDRMPSSYWPPSSIASSKEAGRATPAGREPATPQLVTFPVQVHRAGSSA